MRGSSRNATSQDGSSSRRRAGVATRKKGYIMPPSHKLFGEIGNNPLRSAIETRRAAFGKGGNLGNFHPCSRFGVRRQTGRRVDLKTKIAAA